MSAYPKPFRDVPALLALLQQRGMSVSDPARAAKCLERVGYYRLSGYWYPMRRSIPGATPNDPPQILDQFRPGSDFSTVADLYVFDKRLRFILLDAIERVEVGLKVQIARILGRRDPTAHLNSNELHGNFSRKQGAGPTLHEKWIGKFRRCEERSKEDFVRPFLRNYAGHEFPIWMAVEFWDFGALSHFLSGMKVQDLDTLAAQYAIPRRELLTSWVRGFHTVRNTCAHHSRLWNRPIPDIPRVPKKNEIPLLDHLVANRHAQTRIYAIAAFLQHFMRNIHPGSDWGDRLKAHVQTFPVGPNLSLANGAGFPNNWDQLGLWN